MMNNLCAYYTLQNFYNDNKKAMDSLAELLIWMEEEKTTSKKRKLYGIYNKHLNAIVTNKLYNYHRLGISKYVMSIEDIEKVINRCTQYKKIYLQTHEFNLYDIHIGLFQYCY